MTDYSHTKSRVLQWLGIILIIAVFAGAYWYFQVYGSTLNQSRNDLNTTNLVGLWSFNGDDMSGTTAYDRSGNGNNGTLTNSPQVTAGKSGQALNFFPNGSDSNSYVNMGDPVSGALDFGSGDFAIGFWMKGQGYSAQGSSVNVALNKKNTDSSGTAGYAFRYTSSNLLIFIIGNGTTDYSVTAPTTSVSDNQWHQYTGVRSGSNMYLYIDGVLTGSTSVSGSVSNVLEFIVGSDGTNARNVNAAIDEVRVYSAALTAAQVQSLYTQGGGTKVNTAVSNPQGTGRLDSGLAGYWPLDDGSGTSATDASTNGNTGTLTNGPTWTTGQIEGAVTFDGTNDYMAITPTAVIKPHESMTFAAWVKRTTSGDIDYIFWERDSVVQEEGIFWYISTDNKVHFFFRLTGGGTVDIMSTTTITDTNWHHIVVTSGASNLATFYIDGAPAGSGTTTTPNTGLTIGTAYVGARTNGVSLDLYSDFSIDELRIYNRALSADEVGQLYQLTTPTAVDTGLKGYWSFNGSDVSGTTAYDRSGAGNTGTLTNGPTITAGKVGQGLSFDGTDDYVATTTPPVATGEASVFTWMKATSVSGWQGIVGDVTSGDTPGMYNLELGRTTGQINATWNGSFSNFCPGSQVLTAGTWYHVGFVRTGSSGNWTCKTYVNGVLDNTTTGITYNPATSLNFTIGKTGTKKFAGSLDEVRVYNRALTAAEIKSLYDVGESDKVNSSVSQPQGTGRLDSGLTGYWKMDDGSGTGATDSSTNGNTGTLTNGPTWGTGQIGGAVNFDGADDYVNAGSASTLDDLSRITISAWINPSSAGEGSLGRIVSKGNTQGWELYLCEDGSSGCASSNHTIRFGRDFSGGFATWNSPVNSVVFGQWVHVVVSYDNSASTNDPIFYINAVAGSLSADNNTSGSALTDAAENLIIGNRSDTARTFSGSVDEVRIYNRILSADEVGQLYRLTTPTAVDTGLKGYWSFNGSDVSGTTAYDRSGAGNTGTLTNGPAITEGKIGQGLSFDGTDDYVSIGDPASLRFGAESFSVSTWMKTTSTSLEYMICDYNNANTIIGLGVNNTGNTNKAYFFLRDNAVTISVPIYSTSNVNDGQWHHVVGVRDASLQHSYIYVDGVLEATSSNGAVPGSLSFATLNSWSVGRAGSVSGGYFSGSIDETRVYNRAFTAAEVATLYNSGR